MTSLNYELVGENMPVIVIFVLEHLLPCSFDVRRENALTRYRNSLVNLVSSGERRLAVNLKVNDGIELANISWFRSERND